MAEVRRYRGLLIGNATYPRDPHSLPALNGPLEDIAQLRQVLTEPRIGLFADSDLEILPDYGIQDLRERVDDLFTTATLGDVLLLYYSGHGQLDERGNLYLCAKDTRTSGLRSTALSAIEINNIIDGSPANTTVIILDCCYSGAFKGGNFAVPIAGRGRYVLTSSRSTQMTQAAIHPGQPSPFTSQLIQALRTAQPDQANGHLTLAEVYRQVHQRMTTESTISPQLRFTGEGSVAIARRQASPSPPRKAEHSPSTEKWKVKDDISITSTAQRKTFDFEQSPEPQLHEGDISENPQGCTGGTEGESEKEKPSKLHRAVPWIGSAITIAFTLWSCLLTWLSSQSEGWLDRASMLTLGPLVFITITALDSLYRLSGIDLPWYAYTATSVSLSIGPAAFALTQTGKSKNTIETILVAAILVVPVYITPYLFRAAVMDILLPELHPEVKQKLQLERAEAAALHRKKAESIHLAESMRRYHRLKGDSRG
ncbi:caspase domain-containing protein [Streptomyces sp. NPDC050161]|uniref:caspase domain-containing protein n=1 Tax=Streptomyces sp. NPDC050161 TaxID=3365604 RepID=UPI0037B42B18